MLRTSLFKTSLDVAKYQRKLFLVHSITKSEGGNRSATAQSRRLIYYEQVLGFHGRSGTLVVVVFEALPNFLSTWTIYLDIFGLNHTKPKKGCLKLFQNGNLNDVAWLWLMAVDGEFGDQQQHLSMRGCFACFFLNLQVIAHSAVLC